VPDRDPLLEETAHHLNSGAIHLLRGMRAVDRQAGLTPARLSALSVLVFGGPRTLGQLARAEDVAGPTMTRIVDGLVDLGLARREPHPDSARMSLVSVTDEGRQLMVAAADRRIGAIVAGLGALGVEQRAALVAAGPALRALAEAVRS
jgi:DNA-binding MarR family transcriptional regulator